MVKLIGPAHSTEARGVIGGLIFNTWKGIRYAKRMTSPCQPRTQLQLAIRAIMINLVRSWQSLDADTQSDWNDYAEAHGILDWTGVSKRITGANWYVGLNSRLKKMGFSISESPPTGTSPPSIVSWSCQAQAGGIRCIWEAAAGTGTQAVFYVQGPHSLGLQGKIERARYATNQNGELADYPIPVTQIGHYTIWAFMMNESDGLISTAEVRTCDITTLV